MKLGVSFGALAIMTALLAYFINFNEWRGLSSDEYEWAAFGDFLSGLTTPVLTFITMCLLIRSLDLQKIANQGLIEQNTQTKAINLYQKEAEVLRSFESTFYSLAEVARKEYERFTITTSGGVVFRESLAVMAIEDALDSLEEQGVGQAGLKGYFDSLDEENGMGIFSAVRSFYILFKVTVDNCPESDRQRYIDICVYAVPVKFLHLICLAKVFTDWDNLKLLDQFGFFSRPGINNYVSEWMSKSMLPRSDK